MRTIKVKDKTIASLTDSGCKLSFREKTEIAKLLDSSGVDIISLPSAVDSKTDILLIKNIASVVKNTALSVPSGFSKESTDKAWSCIKDAVKPVINVEFPVSVVGMEYHCGMKPDKMLAKINEIVMYAKTLCTSVEFTASDASRAEPEFLYNALETAVNAGAVAVTVCDNAGIYDSTDFRKFINGITENTSGIKDVTLGVDISDAINMSTACAAQAIECGAGEVSVTVGNYGYASIENIASFIAVKGDSMDIATGINTAVLGNICEKIKMIADADRSKASPYDSVIKTENENIELHKDDDISVISAAVKRIGYELSGDDTAKVYEEFKRVTRVKENFGTKELEAVIAAVAMQVPETYKLVSYVINAGNVITATANLCIEKDGEKLNGVYVGDGPIDASFLAIEQVVGHHFELDDFQIQAITQGREAVGQTLVKLRSSSGRLYSGSGVSTDVIGASISAYLNALNKIVFEENR